MSEDRANVFCLHREKLIVPLSAAFKRILNLLLEAGRERGLRHGTTLDGQAKTLHIHPNRSTGVFLGGGWGRLAIRPSFLPCALVANRL
jgi:hypothetical protein